MLLCILCWILFSKEIIGLAFPIIVTCLEALSIGYRLCKYALEN